MPHKDPEARRAYYREWKRGAKKRLSNKFYDAAKHANQRAEARGIEGRITTAEARVVLLGAFCFYCGGDGAPHRQPLGIDHRVPLALNGPNELGNLVAACAGCNASKRQSAAPRPLEERYA